MAAPAAPIGGNWVAAAIRSWLRRRQGADGQTVRLDHRRIYILPTRSGLVFALVLLAMLAGSLNYGNNMGFALTFFLAAMAVTSLYACHRNLSGITVSLAGAPPVHAGEPLRAEFALTNDSPRTRYQIMLGREPRIAPRTDLAPGQTGFLGLSARTVRRGEARLPPLIISTRFPLGLFCAWAWIEPQRPVLVYPRLEDGTAQRLELSSQDSALADEGSSAAGDEFHGLRPYRPGEPPGRIAWKALARSGELMARDLRGGSGLVWLDWDRTAGTGEDRIARLTRLALDAEADGAEWGLRLPGGELGPDRGPSHLHRCLRALALLPG
ncbi:MAG: DUF58 domain-containing protein [Chromatiales bacterium]|nr:DUF58 domain-containing protein [Chromatiales bacterium]